MVSILRVTLACLLLLSPNCYAASYTVHVLGASDTSSIAVGINAGGDVAGLSGNTPFAWHAGAIRFVEQPGLGFSTFRGQEWTTLGVDNAGSLEAFYALDYSRHLVRYDATGLHELNAAPLHTEFYSPTPLRAFPTGQITGTYQESTTGRLGIFLSQGNDLLPFTLPGWTDARPEAINAPGWIAGIGSHNGRQAGFLLRSGNISDLGDFAPTLLNDKGNLVLGTTVWIGNASYTIKPLAGVPGIPAATGFNNLGQVVGNQGGTPFFWSPVGGTEGFVLQTDPDWELLAVYGINDAGEVAATGRSVNVASPHALKLTPFGRFSPPGSRP